MVRKIFEKFALDKKNVGRAHLKKCVHQVSWVLIRGKFL